VLIYLIFQHLKEKKKKKEKKEKTLSLIAQLETFNFATIESSQFCSNKTNFFPHLHYEVDFHTQLACLETHG
jgi:hypothetical protein